MTARAQKFQDMHQDYLFCRAWHHAWDPIDTTVLEGTILVVTFKCMRCPVTRKDWISRYNGDLLERYYGYPDNYLIQDVQQWGGRKVFNSNVRLEAVRRLRGGRR